MEIPHATGYSGSWRVGVTSPDIRKSVPMAQRFHPMIIKIDMPSNLVNILIRRLDNPDNAVGIMSITTCPSNLDVCGIANPTTIAPSSPTSSYVPKIGRLNVLRMTSKTVSSIIEVNATPAR